MSGGLFHTLSVGAESLFTSRQGVDTASHNIANAHTDGFSKQRVNAISRHPSESRGVIIGNGVFTKNIARAHDKFLEKQINNSGQISGLADGRYDALVGVERIFSPEMHASVVDEMTNFFSAMQSFSTTPEEPGVRTHLRETASALVKAFQRVDSGLMQERESLNEKIQASAQEISGKLQRIADLNVAIGDLETGRSDHIANDLRDEQDRLVREISQDMDVHYYVNKDNLLVVRGPRDTLLVEGRIAYSLETRRSHDPLAHKLVVVDQERSREQDVTDHVKKGKLSSYLDVRDRVIERLTTNNQDMARQLTGRINHVHRQGYGINQYSEATGNDFFVADESKNTFVKSLGISDAVMDSIDAIAAASTPGAAGDNVIANEILRLKDEKVLNSDTVTFANFYSNYVGELAVDVLSSQQRKQAEDIVMEDLMARRESVAGVSLDEEAMNMLKWQANFAASSKVITTTDEMLETVLNMKR